MKKLAVTLALVLGLGFTQANAQNLSYGVKANANMSNFLLSDIPVTNSNLGFGASLGGFMKIQFCENFALQPELMFHFKNSEFEAGPFKSDYQYFGAEIPVYAVGQMKLGKGIGYVGVGPYIGFGFSAKNTTDDIDLYEKNDLTDNAMLKRFDFGAGLMLGYEFSNGIMINAGYQMGLLDAMDAGSDNATMRNQTISLGVGYKF